MRQRSRRRFVLHLHSYACFSMPRFGTALPCATGRDRATGPRPPHTTALGVAGERTGPNARLGERGLFHVGLPEAANNHNPALVSGVQKHGFNPIITVVPLGQR